MIIIGFGIALALAAAVRSTWSPCGLSMLSQITPMAEMGRGRKFGHTAAWFVAGAVLGGCTLGVAIAIASLGIEATGISDTTAIALVAVFAAASATIDTKLLGFGPPFLCRQVNQDWLLNYRSWVYGGGFGWQIGAGVTTYVMTAAVPLMIVVGALGANPGAAIAIGVAFGLVRGLAVLLGVNLRTPAALTEFHRRFDARAEPVRQAVIAVQLAIAVVAAWIAAPVVIAALVTVAAVVLLAASRTKATLTPAMHSA